MSYAKYVKSLLIFFFMAILLIGCSSVTKEDNSTGNEENGEESAHGGELTVAYSAQPNLLDVHVTTSSAAADIMRNTYETLVTFDSNYNIQPMLADSWEQSEDGKTITFTLREGVLFHNGKEMLAEDVVASLNRWKESPGSRKQFTKATFEAKGDYIVTLHLEEALSTALVALAHIGNGFSAIMPKEVIENASPDGVDEYIGTGPFKVAEWQQDQYVHLTKFADYQPRTEPADGLAGKREALVDDIYFRFVTDSSTRVAGIQTGEYDIAHRVPYDNVERLESDENLKVDIYPGIALNIFFNKKMGLFTDVKARQAIATALNMEDVLKGAYSDDRFYKLNHSFMMKHQEEQWSSEVSKEKYNQNDPEKAKQILDDIGYNGEEITIFTTRDYEDYYHASVVVQEQLERIGMKVELQVHDWPTLLGTRSHDETGWDLYIIGLTPVPEPSLQLYLNKDYPGWTDSSEIVKLIQEYRGQPTLDDAKVLFDDFQEWYWDYLPTLKVGESTYVSATRSTVANVQFLDGYILWNVSKNK